MKKVAPILFFFFISSGTLFADRGLIPHNPNVKVFNPTQRAMIAWNGEEEILLLSTDLRASEKTDVLEVIPLPSEPTAKKGDVEVFRKATALINRKLRERYVRPGKGLDLSREGASPAGEVTFHEKIGAHDISVTHVLDKSGFIKWVEEYLRSAGVENPTIPEGMKSVVSEYLDEGFSWFVFDAISLDEIPKTGEAIQYRFACEYLYYPLKISRTAAGDTSVELLVLTPRLLSNFPDLPIGRVKLMHEPIAISSRELRGLNAEMDDLMGSREDLKLRIWQIKGKLSSFDKDLIAK